MALPKPCCSSSMTEEQAKVEVEPAEEPQPSTSAAAAKQMESQENKLSGVEHEKELIRIRAEMICAGCRCGWLCCDCIMGCLSCKQRRRFCYCRWVPAAATGLLIRIPCLICLEMLESCTCQLAWRCKWCKVSMEKCKRGGCLTLLPDRRSPEGATYVEIFNREDKSDDEELDVSMERTMDKLSLAESSSGSSFSWDASSSSRRSSWSGSTGSSQQGEWWQNQRSSSTAAAAASSMETASVSSESSSGDSRYASSSTLSSISSGGSYSSVGGKSD